MLTVLVAATSKCQSAPTLGLELLYITTVPTTLTVTYTAQAQNIIIGTSYIAIEVINLFGNDVFLFFGLNAGGPSPTDNLSSIVLYDNGFTEYIFSIK